MATQIKLRGGTTLEHAAFTGAAREVTVDTDKNTLMIHDGVTVGGTELLTTNSAGGLNLTTWSINDVGGTLNFIVGGVTVVQIDSSGNMSVNGNVLVDGDVDTNVT